MLIAIAALILLSVFLIKRLSLRKPILPTHKQIVFTGNAYLPAISPDGKFIAYVNHENYDEQKVMIQDIVNGQEIEVFSGQEFSYELRWLPDGSELSVCGGKDDDWAIFVVTRLGGTVRRLKYAPYFAWSPDGSQIAKIWMASKEITITNESSGETTSIPLKGSFTFIKGIDWSPANNFLLFLTSDDEERYAIWAISTDGTTQRMVVEDDVPLFSPRWSPRGDAIYYFRRKGLLKDLWKIPVSSDTGNPIKPASLVLSDLQAGDFFTFTSEGTKMLYTREIRSSNLWLATIEGSGKDQKVKTKQLTRSTLWNKYPSISPDGKKVAVYWNRRPSRGLWVFPIEDSSQAFLLKENAYPVGWSADGKWIYAAEEISGTLKIFKISIKGNQTKIILTIPFTLEQGWPKYEYVSMIPDGKKFVFPVYKYHSDVWMVENFDQEMR